VRNVVQVLENKNIWLSFQIVGILNTSEVWIDLDFGDGYERLLMLDLLFDLPMVRFSELRDCLDRVSISHIGTNH